MKIIPKYQKGGNFDSFFTTYTPIQVESPRQTTSQQSSRDSQSNDKGKLTERDFFEMMKEIDGLPNEMSQIASNLVSTFQLSNLTGIDPGNLATMYLQNLYQIKLAAQNKKQFDEALSKASEKGSLAEPAISMSGKLIVQDTNGSIKEVGLDTYFNNSDQYHPLTISNLANLRKYDPSFVKDQKVFDIINNSIGYEEFQKLLGEATQTLGSTETIKNGMFSIEGKALKGLSLLQSLREDDRLRALGSVTAEGLYEYKIIDKNQLNQINALTTYITTVLPDRAKTWAAFKTQQPNKNEATKNLVFTYLLGQSQDSHSFDIKYSNNINKDSQEGSQQENITDNIIENTPVKWLRGLGVQNIFTINSGTNYAVQVLANTMPLTNSNKEYLGANSVLQEATQGEYAGILDFNNASMGMKKLDPSNFSKVVLTDGKISSIDFPSKILNDGTIVPDLSPQISEAKQQADREIKQLGIDLSDIQSISANYKTINDIYVKHNLAPAYNPNGTPTNNWIRFGVINASASNNALGMDQFDSNELLQTIEDDYVVDNLLQITKEENYDKKEWYDRNGVDHFYKGTVWIPVDTSYIAALANNGIKTGQINNIINKEASLNASKVLTREKK